jgi:hypothetical protein
MAIKHFSFAFEIIIINDFAKFLNSKFAGNIIIIIGAVLCHNLKNHFMVSITLVKLFIFIV